MKKLIEIKSSKLFVSIKSFYQLKFSVFDWFAFELVAKEKLENGEKAKKKKDEMKLKVKKEEGCGDGGGEERGGGGKYFWFFNHLCVCYVH